MATELIEDKQKQILLIAPDLLGESLSLQLTSSQNDLDVLLKSDHLNGRPALVIYQIDNSEVPSSISLEIERLQESL